MSNNTLDGDTYCNGTLSAKSFRCPSGALSDDAIIPGAKIDALKLKRLANKGLAQSGVGVTERRVIHRVRGGTAVVLEFIYGARLVPGAATTFTFDLFKNGATILSAAGSLDNTSTNFHVYSATVASPNLVQNDVLEAVLALTGANPPTEPFCEVVMNEDPQ